MLTNHTRRKKRGYDVMLISNFYERENIYTATKIVYDDNYLLLRTKSVKVIFSHRSGSYGKSFHDSFQKTVVITYFMT